MKNRFVIWSALILSCVVVMRSAWCGTEGPASTYYGDGAGAADLADAHANTFVGAQAGNKSTVGVFNVFVGETAGYSNISGQRHTLIGAGAGYNVTSGFGNTFVGFNAGFYNQGTGNLFLGDDAGYSETGSNKLYIDNCYTDVTFQCDTPLLYGEFDNHLVKVNGVLNVRANGVAKSQMHFSKDDTDTGGWITSVLDNNFFLSSGARFDATAGNWIQRSPDNSAVIAGSGGQGYRIFANSGNTVGANFTPTLRLHIDYNGRFGINTAPVSEDEIHTSSGAHLTSGGVWTDASSREYKENVRPLTTEQAMQAVALLVPVTYNYKANREEKHVGFVAEDVPELVATKDRKSLSPMDIVAALTKVVQAQKQTLDEKSRTLESVLSELAKIKMEMAKLKGRVN